MNGRTLCSVTEADAATVDRAVQAARAALRGPWGRLTTPERCALLRKVAERIERRFAEFVSRGDCRHRQDAQQASSLDIPRGAANFRAYADLALARASECFEMGTPDGRGALNYSVHKPVGVVAVIAPWNLPFLLLTWKVAPALACGNTVVAKPSEETPSSAALLAEVMQEVGVPPGVFNLVHGFGPGSAGEALGAPPRRERHRLHRRIRHRRGHHEERRRLGEGAVLRARRQERRAGVRGCGLRGRARGHACARCSPTAARCACAPSASTSSARCSSASSRRSPRARGRLKIGGPYEGADMGPLISRAHREKVLSYYRLARAEHGEIVCGGRRAAFGDERDGGAFIEPTIVRGLAEDARCVKEEIFGPVCHVAPFDSEEQAVRLANDTRYGLAAAVWTSNLQRAHRVARAMEVGIAWVNDWFLRDLRTPFGGVKLSGIGREGGACIRSPSSRKPMNICIKL